MRTFNISGGRLPVIKRMLDLPKGMINFEEVNNYGRTGYEYAKEEGHTSVLELLAKEGYTS